MRCAVGRFKGLLVYELARCAVGRFKVLLVYEHVNGIVFQPAIISELGPIKIAEIVSLYARSWITLYVGAKISDEGKWISSSR